MSESGNPCIDTTRRKSIFYEETHTGSTTVKIAILDENDTLVFSDYERHFANIQETLADLLQKAEDQLGELTLCPVITGSGGLTLANHLEVPFVQEVIAVSTRPMHQVLMNTPNITRHFIPLRHVAVFSQKQISSH